MSEGNLKQILTLGNSIIGVSILAMPYCLKQCGMVLGILLLIICGYINRLNCHFLIKSAISTKRRSYEFLAFHIFGPMGKFAIEVIQIGFLFGICVSFFVIAGDTGPKILAHVLDVECTARFRAFFLAGMCFFIVLPLSLLRNTDSLASISAISISFYVLLVLKIVADSWSHIISGSWQAEVELWRPAGVLQALPIMSLALACQTNVFSIYESLPDPSLSRMNTVVAGAVNLCSSVYILVGFFGYVAFHDESFGGNILVHLVPSPVTRWINVGFVMSICLGFPLVVYPCRVSVNSLLFRRPGSSLELPQNHIPEMRFKCITFCLLVASMCIGIIIPSIEVVLGLLGSTMGTAIAILFPSVMFIKNSSRSNLEKMAAQMSFILGIILLVCGTYMNLYAVDKIAQEQAPALVPVPAVTAPPVVPTASAAAVGDKLGNVTDKKDIIPENPPGVSGERKEEGKKADAKKEEARMEPAIPEPPMDDEKPAADAAKKTAEGGDAKQDEDEKADTKKSKTDTGKDDEGVKADDKGDGADGDAVGGKGGGGGGGGEKKKSSRKTKQRSSKKTAKDAADTDVDANAEAEGEVEEVEAQVEPDAIESKKRSADSAGVGGEGLDVGALQKEEQERERDDALRPEDPQVKELEAKQEAVLQKMEETHKEQKELLQAQKDLLNEMKQQQRWAQPEGAAVGGGLQQPQAVGQAGQQQLPVGQQAGQQPLAPLQPVVEAQQNVPVLQPVGGPIPAALPAAGQNMYVAQPAAVPMPAAQPMAGQPAAVVMPAAQPVVVQQPAVQTVVGQMTAQQYIAPVPAAPQQPAVPAQVPVQQQYVTVVAPAQQQYIQNQQPAAPAQQPYVPAAAPAQQQYVPAAAPAQQYIQNQQPAAPAQQPYVPAAAPAQQFVPNQLPAGQQLNANPQVAAQPIQQQNVQPVQQQYQQQSGQQYQQQPQQQYQQVPQQQYQQPQQQPLQAPQQPQQQQFQQQIPQQQQQQYNQPAVNVPAAAALVNVPAVNQAAPAQAAPLPAQPVVAAPMPAAVAAAPVSGEQAAAAAPESTQKKHRKQAAHDRVRRDLDVSAADDEMLVRLPENWAAVEAAGVRASGKRR